MRDFLVLCFLSMVMAIFPNLPVCAESVSYEANVSVSPYGLLVNFSNRFVQTDSNSFLGGTTNGLLGLDNTIEGELLPLAKNGMAQLLRDYNSRDRTLKIPVKYPVVRWYKVWWGWAPYIAWVDGEIPTGTGIKRLDAKIENVEVAGAIRGALATFPSDAIDKVSATEEKYVPVPLGTMRMVLGSPGYSDGLRIDTGIHATISVSLLWLDLPTSTCSVKGAIKNPNIQARYNPITAVVSQVTVAVDNNIYDQSQDVIMKPACNWFQLNSLDKLMPRLNPGTQLSAWITNFVWSKWLNGYIVDRLKVLPQKLVDSINKLAPGLKNYSLPALASALMPPGTLLKDFSIGDWLATNGAQMFLNNAVQATIQPENMTAMPCAFSGKQYVSRALDAKWSNPLLLMGIDLTKRVTVGEAQGDQCL